MNDPPIQNVGGLGDCLNPPEVANFVTIPSQNECFHDISGMETDRSTATDSSEKSSRKRRKIICKSCNKRKRSRKGHGQNTLVLDGNTDCVCNPPQSFVENFNTGLSQGTHIQTNATLTSHSSQKLISPNTQEQLLTGTTTLQSSPNQQASFEPIGRKEYIQSDVSPYLVHVQRETDTLNSGTTLHPIAFGNFLKRGGFKNIIPGSVKRIGRNKCTVAFSTCSDANEFLKSNTLSLNKFKAFIPTFNVTRIGIVRGVPAEWSLEEVQENITTPIGCGKVIKIRRLNYKVQVNGSPVWKPSESIVITFDGQILPKKIYMCYNALNVNIYVYPTIQCFRCCRYGHTKMQCRAAESRCFKCGQNHTAETCNIEEDCASCIMCSGFHFATSKACPEFKRQHDIKVTMAHSCISYIEASKLHPSSSMSYADKVISNTKNVQSETPKTSYFHPNDSVVSKTTSYKKSVFKKPHVPAKSVPGYDRAAHNAIIHEFSLPDPSNGCALQPRSQQEDDHEQIMDLINSLIKMLQKKNFLKPNNAEMICKLLTVDKSNNGYDSSVEQQISYK